MSDAVFRLLIKIVIIVAVIVVYTILKHKREKRAPSLVGDLSIDIHEYLEGNYNDPELIYDYLLYKNIESYGGFSNNNDKYVYYLTKLVLDVGNGGFVGYFSSTRVEEVDTTIDILKQIGALKTAQLVSEAVSITKFTKELELKLELEVGTSVYSSLSDKQKEEIRKLDIIFWKYEEDFMLLFLEYLKCEKESEQIR